MLIFPSKPLAPECALRPEFLELQMMCRTSAPDLGNSPTDRTFRIRSAGVILCATALEAYLMPAALHSLNKSLTSGNVTPVRGSPAIPGKRWLAATRLRPMLLTGIVLPA
jgi:hypothetical protein